jgi:Fungal specific transcription factor domain
VAQSSTDLGIHELELIHHYQAMICSTLPGQPPVQQTWQSAVPKEAMSHSGLMHALLAIAALHRSHFDRCRSDHYRNVAMRHQSLSLPYLRSLLDNASAENCNALFAHSTIIVVFVSALPQLPVALADFDPFQEIITIIELVKGISAVAGMTRDWILRGPLRSLLLLGAWEASLVIPKDIEDALNCLLLRNDTLIQSNSKQATYNTAIGMLRKTFGMLAMNPADRGMGLLWAGIIDRHYIDLLKAEEPMALVLLAHFGVALHASRKDWWSGNWGYQLVKAVSDKLEDHWRLWIQWPIIRVGIRSVSPLAAPCVLQSYISQGPPKLPIDQIDFPQYDQTVMGC